MRSKKNKKKLFIAIILGVIATFILFSSMNSQKATLQQQQEIIDKLSKKIQSTNIKPVKQVKQDEKINAVVAAKDINVGDVLSLEVLEVKKFMEDEVPPNSFRNEASIVGKKASRNIAKGGFLTSTEIQTIDVNTIDIPNNTRAITIPSDKFRGLASHIKVGSRVDMLKVADPPEFIAQNIKVVSFEAKEKTPTRGEKKQPDNDKYMTAKKASAITFLIPIDLVPELIDAMFDSQLQIIARNNTDEKIIAAGADLPPPPSGQDGSGANIPDVPDIPAPDNMDLPEPQLPAPTPRKIELIKASSRTSLELEPEEYQLTQERDEDSLSDKKLRELLDMVN